MKKFIVIALALILVSGMAFADPEKTEDYIGLNVGAGYNRDQFTPGPGQTRVDSGYQLGLSINDYTFLDSGAPVGIYMEAGLLINLDNTTTINDVVATNIEPPVILFDVVLGPGFRFEAGRGMGLLMSAGMDLSYIDEVYSYSDPTYGYIEFTRSSMKLGLAATAELKFNLGRKFFVTFGAKGTVNFLSWILSEKSTYAGWHEWHESHTDSIDDYFGFRVMPRISAYYTY